MRLEQRRQPPAQVRSRPARPALDACRCSDVRPALFDDPASAARLGAPIPGRGCGRRSSAGAGSRPRARSSARRPPSGQATATRQPRASWSAQAASDVAGHSPVDGLSDVQDLHAGVPPPAFEKRRTVRQAVADARAATARAAFAQRTRRAARPHRRGVRQAARAARPDQQHAAGSRASPGRHRVLYGSAPRSMLIVGQPRRNASGSVVETSSVVMSSLSRSAGSAPYR